MFWAVSDGLLPVPCWKEAGGILLQTPWEPGRAPGGKTHSTAGAPLGPILTLTLVHLILQEVLNSAQVSRPGAGPLEASAH